MIGTARLGAYRHLSVLVGTLLLVAGLVSVTTAVFSQEPSPPTPPKVLAAPHSGASPSVKPKPTSVASLAPAQPSRILIPRIGVSATFVRLGLRPSGEMETPRDPATVGWYTESPAPGALGPSIVAGHVTWNRKPTVFFRLGSLRPGDQVHIQRADGKTAVFAVTKIASYPKDRFPTAEVYGDIDHAGLRLITCGGEYVQSANRYLDNVVVFARLTHSR
jgi:hypothetical protein